MILGIGGAPDYESVAAIYSDRIVVDWFRAQNAIERVGLSLPSTAIPSGINRCQSWGQLPGQLNNIFADVEIGTRRMKSKLSRKDE